MKIKAFRTNQENASISDELATLDKSLKTLRSSSYRGNQELIRKIKEANVVGGGTIVASLIGLNNCSLMEVITSNVVETIDGFYLASPRRRVLPDSSNLNNGLISDLFCEGGSRYFRVSEATETSITFVWPFEVELSQIIIKSDLTIKEATTMNARGLVNVLSVPSQQLLETAISFEPTRIRTLTLLVSCPRGEHFIECEGRQHDSITSSEIVGTCDIKSNKISPLLSETGSLIREIVLVEKSSNKETIVLEDYEAENLFLLDARSLAVEVPFPPEALTLYEGETELEVGVDYDWYLNGAVSNDLSLWPTLNEQDSFYIVLHNRNYEVNYWCSLTVQGSLNQWRGVTFNRKISVLEKPLSDYLIKVRFHNTNLNYQSFAKINTPAFLY
jgi:hypothetical protein